jgi:HEPN domain-containing protein
MLREEDFAGCLGFLQQAAEKFVKGKLIEQGWKLQRVHNLPSLIEEAEHRGLGRLLKHETAALLAVEYIAGRYPTEIADPEPTPERVRSCMKEVSSMVRPAPNDKSKKTAGVSLPEEKQLGDTDHDQKRRGGL